MAPVTVQMTAELFQQGIVAEKATWSLVEGKGRALDVINHVLRVILQLGYLDEYVAEFEALASYQHDDGGWDDTISGKRSGVRNTCFATRNLIRANRVLKRDDFSAVIERAVRFVIAQQDVEGFWPDRRWGPRDATSSSMGLMLYTLNEQFGDSTQTIHAQARACLERAAEYLRRTQDPDGSWPDTSSYEAPIGPTAHLLPKLVLFEGQQTPPVAAAINLLLSLQETDGSWDHQHTDHTCDATRALLLTYSVVKDERLPAVIEGGIQWLLNNANPDGLWGEHPGEPSTILMTCDVLDGFSKYEAHQRAFNLRAFWE